MKTRFAFRFAALVCVCALGVCLSFSALRAQTTSGEPPVAGAPADSPLETRPPETFVNLISLDVLRFFSHFNLSYTRAITPAISLTAQLETPANFANFLSSTRNEGIGMRLEGRYNFSQKNLTGIYAGLVAGFNSVQTINSIFVAEPYTTTIITAVGGMIGYQISPFPMYPNVCLVLL
jgi:hypothetical protein